MVIDAHQHFWQIDRGDYSWMDDSVAAIRKDYLPRDMVHHAHACGVTGTVVVQAAPTVDETLFLLQLADRHEIIKAVVGWIDLAGGVVEQLSHISHPALRGVRPMLQDIEETDWILRDEVVEGLGRIANAGLRLDALITSRHLDTIDELARRLPNLPIAIDHCAKPVFDGSDPGRSWREGMTQLAVRPNVFCKLSGLANEYGQGWSAETLRPAFEHVVKAFGPDRLMWGSDWPVLELAGDYRNWFETAGKLADTLSQSGRSSLFHGTAVRFYGIEM